MSPAPAPAPAQGRFRPRSASLSMTQLSSAPASTPHSLFTAMQLASTKGSYTPLMIGPEAAISATRPPSSSASSPHSPGPAWTSFNVSDLLPPSVIEKDVQWNGHIEFVGSPSTLSPPPPASRALSHNPSSGSLNGTATPSASAFSRRASSRRGSSSLTAASSSLVLDSKLSGMEVLSSLCAMPAPFTAAPVYQPSSLISDDEHVGGEKPGGEFVGMVDLIDCAVYALKALAKARDQTPRRNGGGGTNDLLSPLSQFFTDPAWSPSSKTGPSSDLDEDSLSIPVDASLLVDLSACNPFIPFDVSTPQPLSKLIDLFASTGAMRVVCLEGSNPRSISKSKMRGVVEQASLLAFLHTKHAELGEVGERTLEDLNLIRSVGLIDLPSVEWGEATLMQTLTTWLMHPQQQPPLPALPLLFKGKFVDSFTVEDLRRILKPKVVPSAQVGSPASLVLSRSIFQANTYQEKCREKIKQMSAKKQAQVAPSSLSAHRKSVSALNGVGVSSARSSRPGSASTSRRGSRENISQNLLGAFSIAVSQAVQSGGSTDRRSLRNSINGTLSSRRMAVGNGSRDPSPVQEDVALPSIERIPSITTATSRRASRRATLPSKLNFTDNVRSSPTGSKAASPKAAAVAGGLLSPTFTEAIDVASSLTSTLTVSFPTHSLSSATLIATAHPRSRRSTGDPASFRLPTFSSSAMAAAANNIIGPTATNTPVKGTHSSSSSRRTSGNFSTPATPSTTATVTAAAAAAATLSSSPLTTPSSTLDLGSRRVDGSNLVSSVMRRRSGQGLGEAPALLQEDELTRLERQVDAQSKRGSINMGDKPSSSLSSTDPQPTRRLKRASMPAVLSSSASSASLLSSKLPFPNASTSSAAAAASIAASALSSSAASIAAAPSSASLSISSPAAPPSRSVLLDVESDSLLNICQTGVLIRGDTTLQRAIQQMVQQKTCILWCIGSTGRVSGYLTSTDIFRCLAQNPPPAPLASAPLTTQATADTTSTL